MSQDRIFSSPVSHNDEGNPDGQLSDELQPGQQIKEEEEDYHLSISCVKCHSELQTCLKHWFQLVPADRRTRTESTCMHALCCKCFAILQASRGPVLHLVCPGCSIIANGHTFAQWEGGEHVTESETVFISANPEAPPVHNNPRGITNSSDMQRTPALAAQLFSSQAALLRAARQCPPMTRIPPMSTRPLVFNPHIAQGAFRVPRIPQFPSHPDLRSHAVLAIPNRPFGAFVPTLQNIPPRRQSCATDGAAEITLSPAPDGRQQSAGSSATNKSTNAAASSSSVGSNRHTNDTAHQSGYVPDRTRERRRRKNAKSRAKASQLREEIESIVNKPEEQKTEEELRLLQKHEENRQRKNNRSKEREMERRAEIERILDIPKEQRTDQERDMVEQYFAKKQRKNENDRIRRILHKELKRKSSRGSGTESIASDQGMIDADSVCPDSAFSAVALGEATSMANVDDASTAKLMRQDHQSSPTQDVDKVAEV